VNGLTPRRLRQFICRQLRLGSYLRSPGDGRVKPQIPAWTLLWGLLMGQFLREPSFYAVEALVGSGARRRLGIRRSFGNDALAYFTERLDPVPTRTGLISVLKQAKRNKAFENSRFVGLALDGTKAGSTSQCGCPLCREVRGADRGLQGYRHELSLISVVGVGLSLPFDVEPRPPGEGELTTSMRLLERAAGSLGPRFADYVVADSLYANAPFLNRASTLGLRAVVRLKVNLPNLFAAAQARFEGQPPDRVYQEGKDRVELWDADDFDPWENLGWETVRVVRYRQHKLGGTIVEAYWLTDWPTSQVGGLAIFRMAKSRWEVENQGFNDAKNRHDLEHIAHHHPNSLLVVWLLTLLALVVERLFRLRHCHRGAHPVMSPIEWLRRLRLSLAPPRLADSG